MAASAASIRGRSSAIRLWKNASPISRADAAGPIVRRAIRCAEYDRAARVFDHSLFEEMEVPDSHATLATADAAEVVARAVEAGFTTIKLKAGRNPAAETSLPRRDGRGVSRAEMAA